MSVVGDMLSVVMDGIADTEMILDYADESEGNKMNWFMDRAKKRYQMTQEDYDYVMNSAGIKERASDGDEIAEALCDHLRKQMTRLSARMH